MQAGRPCFLHRLSVINTVGHPSFSALYEGWRAEGFYRQAPYVRTEGTHPSRVLCEGECMIC